MDWIPDAGGGVAGARYSPAEATRPGVSTGPVGWVGGAFFPTRNRGTPFIPLHDPTLPAGGLRAHEGLETPFPDPPPVPISKAMTPTTVPTKAWEN